MKLIYFVFPFLSVALAAQQLSAPKEPPKGSIQGLVVQEPGSQPLKKANIEIQPEAREEGPSYKAVTDADGHFEVNGMAAGRYYISIERTGFLELRRHNVMAGNRTISLNAGEEIKDVTFHMQPAAVITGKVLDGDGDPLANVGIMVIRSGATNFGWRAFAGQSETNDLGEYRVGNLYPGKYLIEAVPRTLSEHRVESKSQDSSRRSVPYPTYYPGTPEKNQAAPIELRSGDEVPINLTIATGPSFHIRGVVTGLPHSSKEMQMMLRTKGVMVWTPAAVKEDGSFEMDNVLPGSYKATFFSFAGSEPQAMNSSQTIEVKDTDLDSLRLTPELPARIAGHMRTEDNSKVDWDRISLRLVSDDESESEVYFIGGPRTDGRVGNDGLFEMKKVPPGKYHLSMFVRQDEMQKYYVKSVILGGSDVNDSGFTVNGSPLSLDVVLSSNSATLEGIVMDGKDQPAKDTLVLAAPSEKLRQRKDSFQQTSTDQRGHFVLHGLRPGEYAIFPLDGIEDEDYKDPDFLKPFEDQAEKVEIGGSEHKNVAVKVISITARN